MRGCSRPVILYHMDLLMKENKYSFIEAQLVNNQLDINNQE